jgi:hypothetical protein
MVLRMYDAIVRGATTVVCSSAKYRGLISATCGSIYRYVRAGIQHYSYVYTCVYCVTASFMTHSDTVTS